VKPSSTPCGNDDRAPKNMCIGRQTAEHPFGTIKAWMRATHLLARMIEWVRTEMSLVALAYNMKTMIAILAVQPPTSSGCRPRQFDAGRSPLQSRSTALFE
jgi:hypothetical protein